MAYPLKAYYGRDTYALLSRCMRCGEPYDGTDGWHTLQSSAGDSDSWLLLCDRCHDELGEGGRMAKCEHRHVKGGPLCDVYRTSCGVEYVEDRTCMCNAPGDASFCPWCGRKLGSDAE